MKRILSFTFVVIISIISFASEKNPIVTAISKIKDGSKANEQVLSPTLDGFVRQQQGDFLSGLTYGELKKQGSFNREVYLNFDFSNITINAKTAKLRVFCQSFDKYSEPTISVYCFPGYQTDNLTWASRPVYPAAIGSISINQLEFSNSWLEWNISPFLTTVLATQSKQATIVVAITAGNDALIKLNMSENGTNQPSVMLTEEEPIIVGNGNSKIIMPTLFSDNMVLQRDKPINVWGQVLPNEPVIITFDGQIYNTQCDSNGKFATTIPAKSASLNTYTMAISAANELVTYSNLVMGDVFICSGQSNMAFKVSTVKADQLANAKADANYPNLRYFDVAKIVNGGVLTGDIDKPWKAAIPERVLDWSAVAFFTGRDLHKHLNIPIGLINISHGGAPSDAFISPEAYANDPILNAAKRPDGTGIYNYYQSPSSLYNAMVSKVVGYPIKAVLWYQAEANALYWQNYKTIFKGLITDWRTKWKEPTLPWLFVQLPAYEASELTWAETRDIQLQVWKDDQNTGMAVTMDLGEATNIHPTDKYTVAKRLLPYAKALVYGEQITHKSPIYKSHEVQGADLILTFDNIGGGLIAVKEITEFEIAAADKVYKIATATLLPDNRIKLSNVTISNPIHIRYAFKNNSTISIFTTDELPLPLSPFRSEVSTPIVYQPTDLSEITFDKINNAYASSTYTGRIPLYAINGAGLIGDAHEASITSKAWHTNDVPFPHFFKIELKTPQEVAALRIWNLNWTSTYLNRGVKDIEIYVSESTSAIQNTAFSNPDWIKVVNYTMNQATGDNTYKGEMLGFPAALKNVKWVGINILNSYNNVNGYMGLSEVKLYSLTTLTHLQPVVKNIPAHIFVQNNTLQIKPLTNGATFISLYSISGIKIFSQTLYNSSFEFSTNSLAKGCYFLSLTNGEIRETVKILI